MTWPLTQLSDLSPVITKRTTPTTLGYKFVNEGIGFLRVQNIEGGTVNFERDTLFIDKQTHKNLGRSQIQPGDVLVSIAGTIGRAGVVPDSAPPLNCNQAVAIVRTNGHVFRPFLRHWLESPLAQEQMRGVTVTGTISNLSLTQLGNLQLPLPPLPEQKRIAAILDKADSILRKRQEAVRLTEELLRSVFLDMFGDPVENAKGWPLMPIGSAINAIETGWSANSEDRPREDGEWAVLKISSVTSGRFLPEEYKVVADGQIDRELLTPKRGDLLFSRANTRELVAATCLVEQDEPKLFLPDKLWKILPDEEITCTEYLRYLLAHPRFREKLTKQATGTSGSMLNISQAKVRGIEMPLPPMKLQKQFAAVVWRNYNIRSKLEVAFQSSNNLFNSLLQRAFAEDL